MMIGMPFLTAAIPGVIALLLTWYFKKRSVSLGVRLLPGISLVGGAIYLLYYGLEVVRGFEGGAYGILAFFLLCFSAASIIIATKSTLTR
ncbi:YesK family protein [Fictibacillus iocasae]|uniref:YesK family protein n=1 Tax=Fictibacillus iocasae TaxID=2715437 RepID=A0ABW2NPY0_9BACL